MHTLLKLTISLPFVVIGIFYYYAQAGIEAARKIVEVSFHVNN